MVGLLVNLKYPKLNYSNDTEVIKQSMSSMISVFIGMIVFVGFTYGLFKFVDSLSLNTVLVIFVGILCIVCSVLYYILNKYGVKDYERLSV